MIIIIQMIKQKKYYIKNEKDEKIKFIDKHNQYKAYIDDIRSFIK